MNYAVTGDERLLDASRRCTEYFRKREATVHRTMNRPARSGIHECRVVGIRRGGDEGARAGDRLP